jgi:hypothetical protein
MTFILSDKKMKTPKKNEVPKLTGEQIIQKKLNEINPFVKNIDWANLSKRKV